MVLFIGLQFDGDRVHTTVVDRKARLVESGSVIIPRLGETESPGVLEVPHQEWTRAGSLALQDGYARIPIQMRKVWGLALSGPEGWIAVDPDLDPVSPLRITPGISPVDDLTAWLDRNPKARAHIYAVFSPKDYFRVRISGGLAADATQASLTGLLREGRAEWSAGTLEERGLRADWMPPVFESTMTTGRISEAGVELTGVPGGVWMVAGSGLGASSEVSAGVRQPGDMLCLVRESSFELRLALDGADRLDRTGTWARLRSALPGRQSLVKIVPRSRRGPPDRSELEEVLIGARAELADLDRPAREVIVDWREGVEPQGGALDLRSTRRAWNAGRPDCGPALLAGLAKRVFRDVPDMDRKLRDSLREGEDRAVEGPGESGLLTGRGRDAP